jgi:hypothetical protein
VPNETSGWTRIKRYRIRKKNFGKKWSSNRKDKGFKTEKRQNMKFSEGKEWKAEERKR